MAFDLDEDELKATRELNGVGMSEEEIVAQMKEFVDWIKANKDKVNKSHELLTILEGMLNLYWMEKEKNQKLEKAFQDIIDMISEEIEKSDNHKGDE